MQDPTANRLDLDSHVTDKSLDYRSALSADLTTRRIAEFCQKDERFRYFTFVLRSSAFARKVRHCINQIAKAKVLQEIGVADLLAYGNEGFAFVKMRTGSMLEQHGYHFCQAHAGIVNNQVYDGMRASLVYHSLAKIDPAWTKCREI